MIEESILMAEYRMGVRQLMSSKSASPIFPKSTSCISIVLQEAIYSSDSTIEMFLNSEACALIDTEVVKVFNARLQMKKDLMPRIILRATSCAALQSLTQAKCVVMDDSFAPNLGPLSFILVDRTRLIFLDTKEPRVVFMPNGTEQIQKASLSFFDSLWTVLGPDAIESRKESHD